MLDRRGRERSPITLPEHRLGKRPANAGKRYPAEAMSRGEVLALLMACNDGPTGIRDQALIAVLWRSGLRIAEALTLRPCDVDPEHCTLFVRSGKGARGRGPRQRVAGSDPQAMAYVQHWLQARVELGLAQSGALFCTASKDPTPGRPQQAAVVREGLKRLARRAGVQRRVHPHGLRHTHAFELAMESVPIPVIRAQLGHERMQSTEVYIDHVAPTQVIAHLARRTWSDPPAPRMLRVNTSDEALARELLLLLAAPDTPGAARRPTSRDEGVAQQLALLLA